MAIRSNGFGTVLSTILLLASVSVSAIGGNTLSTDSYKVCLDSATVQVNSMDISYNRLSNLLKFDVAGESEESQRVMAHLTVSAYGNVVYNKEFNPCDNSTYVKQLCPVPAGSFSAQGQQKVPEQYASMIPSIAFAIPDFDGEGKITLTSLKTNKEIACIHSHIGNGATARSSAVTYTAAGIAGGALVLSGLSSLGSFNHPGAHGMAPSFTQTLTWFQSIAINGMMSVKYPAVYQSFSQNFAFSTGLVPWDQLQTSIDNFRASTGGNLTHDNVQYLKRIGGSGESNIPFRKRNLLSVLLDYSSALISRNIQDNANGNPGSQQHTSSNQTASNNDQLLSVNGIKGFAQSLLIPQSNVFMTVLLVFAIILAAIAAGILLFKVILEAWALFGNFPKGLVGFRKRYWLLLGKTITNLILALYSVWTLYCIYQFKIGDSWAAKLLAGVTLGIFTAILLFFSIKIWLKARKAKKMEGDTSLLYEDKEVWVKYSLFYDNYKRGYWWLFIPVIICMFARGCVIAAGYGHGLVQCGGQLIVDAFLLALLLWSRPYSFKSGNWINIIIQVVRVLSVVCILVFAEELQVNQTTKTITGIALIIVQAVLTGLLGILIAVNWLIQVCKKNPHRKARKEAEKLRNEEDELTPLDAHNSMLLHSMDKKIPEVNVTPLHTRGRSLNGYDAVSSQDDTSDGHLDITRVPLARSGQRMGSRDDSARSISPESGFYHREPQLPDLSYSGRGIAM